MKKFNTRSLAAAAMIACLYAVLTLTPGLSAISFGPVQFRIAEALCALPIVMPTSVLGLTVGCFIANIFSPMALDMVFGTLATLIGALLTYAFRKKKMLALLMPAISNGIIIGFELTLFWSETDFELMLLLTNMATVALGEIVVCYGLGLPLLNFLLKRDILK